LLAQNKAIPINSKEKDAPTHFMIQVINSFLNAPVHTEYSPVMCCMNLSQTSCLALLEGVDDVGNSTVEGCSHIKQSFIFSALKESNESKLEPVGAHIEYFVI